MVYILDRYCSDCDVPRDWYQLVGCVSLWLASKYNDLIPLFAQEIVACVDGNFDANNLLEMEVNFIKHLDFNLTIPLPILFLRRFLLNIATEPESELLGLLAHFFSEALLLDIRYMGFKPSNHAAVAFYWAIQLVNADRWNGQLESLCKKKRRTLKVYGPILFDLVIPTEEHCKCSVQRFYFRNHKNVYNFFYGNKGENVHKFRILSQNIYN